MVCEFSDVFPNDICNLPQERDVYFTIDLVPGTSHVSMAPYMMSTSELGELIKQLDGLHENKFVRPNVSSWGVPVWLVIKKDGIVSL